MGILSKGSSTEEEFGKELFFRFGIQPIRSNKQEDINLHWDWKCQDYKYDVKSKACVTRGEEPSESYVWIEIINVQGKKGWLFGDADMIAFDRGQFWILVDRKKLVIELSRKLNWDELTPGSVKAPWKVYQRPTQKDGIVLVPIKYLFSTEPTIWWKRK
jgi:hypothetical protein